MVYNTCCETSKSSSTTWASDPTIILSLSSPGATAATAPQATPLICVFHYCLKTFLFLAKSSATAEIQGHSARRSQTDRQTDGRTDRLTNIMVIAWRFVLANASRDKNPSLRSHLSRPEVDLLEFRPLGVWQSAVFKNTVIQYWLTYFARFIWRM